MAGLTVAGQQATCDYIVAQAPYIALCTTVPTDTAAGTEAAYTGYARKLTAAGDWAAATAAVPSVKSNSATVSFAQCTGGTANVTHFELWTAATGGVRWGWGALNAALAVSSGITPSFSPGQLTVTVD